MQPTISVVMAVFNTGHYLRQCIDSVLGQTLSDFEFIIVDDGSTDDTAEIVNSYSDPRIVFISNTKNRGVPFAANQGLAAARGSYIARLDGDDVCLPERLEQQLQFMRARPHMAASGSWAINIGEQNEDLGLRKMWFGKRLDLYSRLPSPILNPSSIIRTEVAKELLYDESYAVAQDYDFWLRVQKNHRIANLPEPLMRYRVHQKSLTGRFQPKQLTGAHRSFNDHVMPVTMDVFMAMLQKDFSIHPAERWRAMCELGRKVGVRPASYAKNQARYTYHWCRARDSSL